MAAGLGSSRVYHRAKEVGVEGCCRKITAFGRRLLLPFLVVVVVVVAVVTAVRTLAYHPTAMVCC